MEKASFRVSSGLLVLCLQTRGGHVAAGAGNSLMLDQLIFAATASFASSSSKCPLTENHEWKTQT